MKGQTCLKQAFIACISVIMMCIIMISLCTPIFAQEQENEQNIRLFRIIRVNNSGSATSIEGVDTRWGTEAGHWTCKYDEAGHLIRKQWTSENGEQKQYSYRYDQDGRLDEEIYLEAGKLIYQRDWEYSANHRIEAETSFGNQIVDAHSQNADQPQYDQVYIKFRDNTYDSKGNLISSQVNILKQDGDRYAEEKTETTYLYDAQGNRVEEIRPTGRISRKYDENNRLQEEKTITDIVQTTTYTYDDDGNLIEKKTNEGDNILEETHYTYENGDLAQITYLDGSIVHYQYYQQGSPIYILQMNADGSTVMDKFQYHPNGVVFKRIRETKEADAADQDLCSITWEYDEYGNLLEYTVQKTKDGKETDRFQQTYLYEEIYPRS